MQEVRRKFAQLMLQGIPIANRCKALYRPDGSVIENGKPKSVNAAGLALLGRGTEEKDPRNGLAKRNIAHSFLMTYGTFVALRADLCESEPPHIPDQYAVAAILGLDAAELNRILAASTTFAKPGEFAEFLMGDSKLPEGDAEMNRYARLMEAILAKLKR